MLNPFPTLLSFSLMAPLILRLTVGIILLGIGVLVCFQKKQTFLDFFKNEKFPFPPIILWIFGILEIITGLFLIIGFYTQIFAIISAFLLLSLYSFESRDNKLLPYSPAMYLVLTIISLSLLFSGAGFFAIDLPL